MSILEAHFIEQPLFANTAVDEFAAVVAISRKESFDQPHVEYMEHEPIEEQLVVEFQKETQISSVDKQPLRLLPTDKATIDEQKVNFRRLSELFSFVQR